MADAKKIYRSTGIGPWTNAAGEKVAVGTGDRVALTEAEYRANTSHFETARPEDQDATATRKGADVEEEGADANRVPITEDQGTKNIHRATGPGSYTNAAGQVKTVGTGDKVALSAEEYRANTDRFAPARPEDQTTTPPKIDGQTSGARATQRLQRGR